MPKRSTLQPTFEEAQEIAANPHLQNLMRWYPDQHDRILRAYHRRNRPFATVKPPPLKPRPGRRLKTPSRTGQYREQLLR